jgi:methionyl-tRNA formyltransferase
LEIQALCEKHEVAYAYREKGQKIPDTSYVFAVSWRWIINHPQNKLVVFHDSLLPKYRGFAPLVNMLLNKEEEIGVTALLGSSEYDRGDIIAQQSSKILYPIKIEEAIKLNTENYKALAEKVIAKIASSQTLDATPQNEAEATYSIWRDNDDYFINWATDANDIKSFVDALGSPYKGAQTRTQNDEIIVIQDVQVVDDIQCEIRHTGKVIFVRDGLPTVICGKGLLKITNAYVVTKSGQENYLPLKKFRTRFR